ncbi:3-methyladenine DNA glycosylase [Sulfurospirillum arcachonense]|uniref:3-methyladenine DNA glycosylase n=1 Tax=Sulfurospirillum arcachonense TaxID=57666 RepID=UPI00046AAE34|nr:3-methyladenine DNA glycosylase [Sulfurospirillum arcachonense]
MQSSYDLFKALKDAGYIKEEREELWWPKSRTFEVIVGTVLTQQAKWEKVEICLENLRERNLLDLDSIASIDVSALSLLIKPSGFYNNKAKNLKKLCQNISEDFGSFEEFALHVTKEWLLSQKGIGEESCDSILCYACGQETMVVDSYTNRLLTKFGYEFESYSELQEWLIQGIESNYDKINKLYKKEMDLNTIYARFHGKIVEFCKENMRGKNVNIDILGLE